jgi:hypothetical protein
MSPSWSRRHRHCRRVVARRPLRDVPAQVDAALVEALRLALKGSASGSGASRRLVGRRGYRVRRPRATLLRRDSVAWSRDGAWVTRRRARAAWITRRCRAFGVDSAGAPSVRTRGASPSASRRGRPSWRSGLPCGSRASRAALPPNDRRRTAVLGPFSHPTCYVSLVARVEISHVTPSADRSAPPESHANALRPAHLIGSHRSYLFMEWSL